MFGQDSFGQESDTRFAQDSEGMDTDEEEAYMMAQLGRYGIPQDDSDEEMDENDGEDEDPDDIQQTSGLVFPRPIPPSDLLLRDAAEILSALRGHPEPKKLPKKIRNQGETLKSLVDEALMDKNGAKPGLRTKGKQNRRNRP